MLDDTYSQASSSLAFPQSKSPHEGRDYGGKDDREDRRADFAKADD